MLSDFTQEIRFPIDSRKKETSGQLVISASPVVAKNRVSVEDSEEKSEDSADDPKFMSCEEMTARRKERELRRKDSGLPRLNCDGNIGSSKNDKQEKWGQGHRSQVRNSHF